MCIDRTAVVAPPNPGDLECNKEESDFFQNSLYGISLAQPCKIAISGNCATSTSSGMANFSALDFGSSPTGAYSISFIEPNAAKRAEGISKTFEVKVPAFDGSIRRISKSHKLVIPLQTIFPAPQFEVLRNDGKPAPAGVQLRAFVWDGFKSPLENGLNTNLDEYAFGELRGDTAVTDDNGIATFSELQLIGSTASYIFINVTIANAKFASLSDDAIQVVPLVSSVSIQSPHSNIQVTERKPFPSSMQVKIQCSSASMCANRRVYASVDYISGNRVRKVQFRSFFNTKPKILYNATATTDSNGVATFSALQFSADGRSGAFQISFVCDGVYSASLLTGTILNDIGISSVGARVKYKDSCENRIVSRKLVVSQNMIIKNAADVVEVNVSLTFSSPKERVIIGKKPVQVELLSDTPGMDFQFIGETVPIVTDVYGSCKVLVNILPYANGRIANDSVVTLRISIDDLGVRAEIPFLFTFSSSNDCSPSPAPPNPSDCQSGGFMSVFTGSYQSAGMKTWTPWYPGRWSSDRPFDFNFTLNSIKPPSICNISSSDDHALLVCFFATSHHCTSAVLLRLKHRRSK